MEYESPIDLSEYKTPHGAAKRLATYLTEVCEAGDACTLYTPDETKERRAIEESASEEW